MKPDTPAAKSTHDVVVEEGAAAAVRIYVKIAGRRSSLEFYAFELQLQFSKCVERGKAFFGSAIPGTRISTNFVMCVLN